MSTSEERVARGAAWLDEVAPGWERKIDLATLDLADSAMCVCGQVEPIAASGTCSGCIQLSEDYGLNGYTTVLHHANISTGEFGFDDQEGDQEAWEALIKGRFDTGTLSDEAAS